MKNRLLLQKITKILSIMLFLLLVKASALGENAQIRKGTSNIGKIKVLSIFDERSTMFEFSFVDNDNKNLIELHDVSTLNLIKSDFKKSTTEHLLALTLEQIKSPEFKPFTRRINMAEKTNWFNGDWENDHADIFTKSGSCRLYLRLYVDKENDSGIAGMLNYKSLELSYWQGVVDLTKVNKLNENLIINIKSFPGKDLTTWKFVIHNKCGKELQIPPFLTWENRIVLVAPDCKVIDLYSNVKSPVEKQPSVFVKAGDSITFEQNISELPGFKDFVKDDGIYRVFWEVEPIRPIEMMKGFVSQEICFVKEKDSIKEVEKKLVDLKIMPILDPNKMSTDLVFYLTNNTQERIYAYPVAVNSSKIVIVKPDGKIVEYSVKDDPENYMSIAPVGEKLWQFDLSKMENYKEITKDPGIYEVYWKLKCEQEEEGKKETRKQKEYQSEPLLFLREPQEEQNQPEEKHK